MHCVLATETMDEQRQDIFPHKENSVENVGLPYTCHRFCTDCMQPLYLKLNINSGGARIYNLEAGAKPERRRREDRGTEGAETKTPKALRGR